MQLRIFFSIFPPWLEQLFESSKTRDFLAEEWIKFNMRNANAVIV